MILSDFFKKINKLQFLSPKEFRDLWVRNINFLAVVPFSIAEKRSSQLLKLSIFHVQKLLKSTKHDNVQIWKCRFR